MNTVYAQEFETHEEVGEEAHSEEFEEQTVADQVISGGVIIVVIIALVVAARLYRQFGGKLQAAIMLFSIGILVNLATALWGLLLPHRISIGDISFDNHNIFMIVATLFFMASIQKFTRLIPREI
jgi:hypothetical protein